MVSSTTQTASPRRLGSTFAVAAALLALPLICGCAQSASIKWAQNSATIAPSKRPPALTAFSAMMIEKYDDEVQ